MHACRCCRVVLCSFHFVGALSGLLYIYICTYHHGKTPSFRVSRAIFTLDQKGRIPPLLRGNAHNVTQSVRKQAGSDIVEYLQSKREAFYWAARTHACSKNTREAWPAGVVKSPRLDSRDAYWAVRIPYISLDTSSVTSCQVNIVLPGIGLIRKHGTFEHVLRPSSSLFPCHTLTRPPAHYMYIILLVSYVEQ